MKMTSQKEDHTGRGPDIKKITLHRDGHKEKGTHIRRTTQIVYLTKKEPQKKMSSNKEYHMENELILGEPHRKLTCHKKDHTGR